MTKITKLEGTLVDTTFRPAAPEAIPSTKLNGVKIGPLPISIYVGAAIVCAAAVYSGKLPNDVIGGLLVLMLLGFLLGKLGQTIPVLKQIGGTAILCLFVPAALVSYGLMPDAALKAITTTFRTANFQYFFIACLVAGSILGMPYRVLVQGFIRMFVPLLIGTIAAVSAGILVGLAFGYTPKDTFFFIIIPIVGGGLAEGVLPLSIAYSEILQRPQADLVAHMVPAALLGNVVAIVCAGLLARLGERRRDLSGQGMLVKTGDNDILGDVRPDRPIDLGLLGAGMVLSCGLFVLGMTLAPFTGIPGPIMMIIAAVALKLTKILPNEMELGAYQINKFMSTNLTFAILVAMGALLVKWEQLVASFNPGYIMICTATVLAMIASGFYVGKWLNMYPVEAAIVTACHSGLGGTGDVAILGAADRMGLMAFAQIATRVGGAIMIVIATLLLKSLS
ncbi:malate permease (plasmid) [Bradyrhizobium sp. CCBAU 53351]|uniref:Malate permease n=2 Tax=Bradyrhizobium TaxID=374 RepID=A0AAE6CCK4_9BRAD|nr:2-hydroxycarboxylate transporter family protein [Bradyrhizobium sp. WYCCWR 12699]QAU43429.1 malate permease [Bradyrhizobium guangdongense]QAU50921.1 malate permease [Bradyrhizobium guangzhouense]QOZ49491.1 malate permease [Bradyrhizobium sp. CCBAU 53340]QOZ56607.1 malate permease [Bradyrhizobium sp. CCBAU 53338]QOZ81251.1 malate permease [Bradyrhizobium sp. CCBAU 53351]